MSELLLNEGEEDTFMSGGTALDVIKLKREVKNLKQLLEKKEIAHKTGVSKLRKEHEQELLEVQGAQVKVVTGVPGSMVEVQQDYIQQLEAALLFIALYDDVYHNNQEEDFGASIVNTRNAIRYWADEHIKGVCKMTYKELGISMGLPKEDMGRVGTAPDLDKARLTKLKKKLLAIIEDATVVDATSANETIEDVTESPYKPMYDTGDVPF